MTRLLAALTLIACCCGFLLLPPARANVQSQCAAGTPPTPEQQARRREGVGIARLVNTAQANQPGARERKFLGHDELPASPHVRRLAEDPFVKSLKLAPGEEVLPGWELKLDVTADGYWFMVKDKSDPCGLAFISNQNGLIYTAEPLR